MQINKLCSTLIEYCIIASRETVPLARPNAKKIAGWCDNVKDSRDTSLFWHWVWLEAGKPMTGHVYCIMKRTRHRYPYAVRCAKRKSAETTRTKLAENIANSKDFWRELSKIDAIPKSISNTIDQAVGPEKISDIFSSFFFFRKNYLLLSYATSVRPSVCPSVCPSVRLWK